MYQTRVGVTCCFHKSAKLVWQSSKFTSLFGHGHVYFQGHGIGLGLGWYRAAKAANIGAFWRTRPPLSWNFMIVHYTMRLDSRKTGKFWHTRCEMKLGLLFLRLAEHGVGANPTSRLAIGGIALWAAKHKQHSCKTTTTWIQRKQLSVKASHAQVW